MVAGNHANNINVTIHLNAVPIKRVNTCKHLGVEIGANSSKINTQRAAHDIIRKTNLILSNFGHCSWNVLKELFKSYCGHAYGCPLWNLDKNALSYITAVWKKCARKIMKVSPLTRSKYIPFLMSCNEMFFQLNSRFVRFFVTCINSTNALVALAGRLSYTSFSTVAFNARRVLSYLRIQNFSSMNVSIFIEKLHKVLVTPLYDNELSYGITIVDLLDARDSVAYVGFDTGEILTLLFWLCVQT